MRKESFEKEQGSLNCWGETQTVNESQHRKEVERIKGKFLLFWIIITMLAKVHKLQRAEIWKESTVSH